MEITKATRFQIVKPMDVSWPELHCKVGRQPYQI